MNLVLRSLTHPKLAALSIPDSLCLIGRDKPPFASFESAASSGLAVHHACIFRVENEFYLIDFGAGTAIRHNDRALLPKRPVKLAHDDELWFAGGFGFRVDRVEGDEHATAPSSMAPVQLALLPAPDRAAGETVAIHGAPPLLIGRDMMRMVLAEGATAMPAAIKTLSRCHALLFLKNDKLQVMDLGSANGTWRGEQRIAPFTEFPLAEGDTLTFGSPGLRYTVRARLAEDNDRPPGQKFDDEQTANSSGLYHVGKTVYIKAANSFLKILIDQPADDEPAEPAGAKPGVTTTPLSRAPSSRMRAFIRELGEALGSGERPRRRIWLAGVAAAVALAAVGLYLQGGPQRDIKALVVKGEYRAGLERASEYLRRNPGDAAVSALALEALAREAVPGWQTEIEAGRFAAAADRLREIQARAIPESEMLRGLLAWIGDLQGFLAERGGRDAPLRLFHDESTIAALMQRWDDAARDYELLSLKIVGWVPSFQELHRQVLSQQRLLRNEQAVYLKAIAELEQSVRQQLADGHTDGAMAHLERFALQYPRIVGLDPLRRDIARLETLQRAARDQDLNSLLGWQEVAFATPWVRETAARWTEEQLPPRQVLERYQTALAAWQAGKTQQAITLLEALLQERAGPVIEARLEHFQQVAAGFEQLRTARGQPDYSERLLELSHILHPAEDRFFLEALAEDLRVQRQALSARARTLFQQAASHWAEYQRRGGISGLMRLEQTVSQPFRQQTQRLAQAHEAASRGARLYDLLRETYPEAARKLYDDILAEARRQRQSLADLRVVMNSTLLEAKLRLLPDPRTTPP
jgi:pSer/pThr/pTyr-binding forkhead associated (FHA) protein